MRKLLLASVAALGLSACAAYTALTGASLTTTQVYVAAQAFDAAEITATNYLNLPACITGGPAICRNPKAVAAIVAAARGGYQARQTLVSTCAASVDSTACVSAYTTVTTAVTGLQNVFTQYSVQKGS